MRGFLVASAVVIAAVATLIFVAESENPKYRLEGEMTFANEVWDSHCRRLIVDEKDFGWVAFNQESETFITFEYCLPSENDVYEGVAGKIGGYSGPVNFLELNGNLESSEIPDSNFDYFSNHALCESFIAYWGYDPDEDFRVRPYYAKVMDLRSKQIIHSQEIGHGLIPASDYSAHLHQPEWKSECSSVTFDHQDKFHLPAQATITLQ